MDTLENRLQRRIHVSLYALLFLTVLLGISVLLEGCSDKCQLTSEYAYYEPVYTTIDELRSSVRVEAPRPLESVGKIYYKGETLFVNEPGNGIHIINNADPAHPVSQKFLSVPGSFDLAVKGNTLYTDSYVDLVAFDIRDLNNIQETARLQNVFTNVNSLGFMVNANGVVTDWEKKTMVNLSEPDCETVLQPWGGVYYDDGIALTSEAASNFSARSAITPGTGSGPGVGGSLNRFAINASHLYMIDGADMQVIDVTKENSPIAKSRLNVAWGIETIFPFDKTIFVGSTAGMHIYDISTPEAPVKVSTYQHIQSCDPVVVDGQYAYVTLRSGTACQGFTNQLEVIDIKNLASPQVVKVYPFTNPHGLGIDDTTLFICDGDAGLKIFDASDVNAIDKQMLAHYKDINATDVIPFENVLMMIGTDGIYQYDYSNASKITLLSHIEIVPHVD
jgi:hypothetical protein